MSRPTSSTPGPGEGPDVANPADQQWLGAPDRGSIALHEHRCTSCMVCVRECPTWCITLEAHLEPIGPAAGAGRPVGGERAGFGSRGARTRLVLDRFDIDFARCMYCGICVESCPVEALSWSPIRVTARAASPGTKPLVAQRAELCGYLTPLRSSSPVRAGEESGAAAPEPRPPDSR